MKYYKKILQSTDTYVLSLNPLIMTSLTLKKLRLKESKWLVQGHAMRKWQSQGSKPAPSDSKSVSTKDHKGHHLLGIYWIAGIFQGFPAGSAGKECTYIVGGLGSFLGLGRSPGEGKGYPLQYSGLEDSILDTTEQLSL